MAARKPARYLAPVALIAVAVAVILIVEARTARHHSPPPAHRAAVHNLPATHHHTSAKPRYYVIKPGDSLSTISVKTGVPIATLTALNPGIDPAALQAGQRLLLRR